MQREGAITCQSHSRYYTIVIDRPEKKNALTLSMYQSLVAHLKEAEMDDSVHFIVLRGAKHCFTAGNDLSDFSKASTFADLQPILQFLHAFHRFPKPIIVAVEGEAIGIGTTLLLHCDYVIAADSARFQLPFSQIGLCPEFASSLLLPQFVGMRQASALLMLGQPFEATKAYDMGLINELVPARSLDTALARTIAQFETIPLQSLIATKQLLRKADQQCVTDTINQEAREFGRLLQTDTAQQIIGRFLKKGSTHD